MNEENSFMKEKIKEKPFYKKKWVQILCTTIVIAVIFGVISAFVFSKMSDWIEEKQAQEAKILAEKTKESITNTGAKSTVLRG